MDTLPASMNRRPSAFARLDGLFWADPWISSHVLYAHLDGRSDDASRPLRVIEKEVAWLHSLFPAAGKVLDLGCGPGLHGLLFAEKGWQVTGIDASAVAIEYAQKEAYDAGFACDFRAGDFQQLGLPQQQDLVLIAYGTMGTLSPAAARRLVARCRRALKPGGLLVFDLFRQSWWQKQVDLVPDRHWDMVLGDGFWAPGPHLVLTRSYAYPVLRTFGRIFAVVEGLHARQFPFWYRWYEPDLAQAELLGGWQARFFGGLEGSPLRPRSSWFAVVARRE